jgi:hypothetical protein
MVLEFGAIIKHNAICGSELQNAFSKQVIASLSTIIGKAYIIEFLKSRLPFLNFVFLTEPKSAEIAARQPKPTRISVHNITII